VSAPGARLVIQHLGGHDPGKSSAAQTHGGERTNRASVNHIDVTRVKHHGANPAP
jgi:hypothetical protein